MRTFRDFDISITKGSGHERTLCPSCSADRKKKKVKCLSVNIDEGVWFCHHCGYSGTLSGKKSDRYIKPEYKPARLNDKATKFFIDRGISEDVLNRNSIGVVGSALTFPYVKGGEVVNVKSRAPGKKFFQSKDGEPCLYRFDAVSLLSGPIVVTEGELDCLAVQTAGHERVTSIPSGSINGDAKSTNVKMAFLDSAKKMFDACDKIVLALDNDEPGVAMTAEMVRRIGQEKCYIASFPAGCKDLNEVLIEHGKQAVLESISKAAPCPIHGLLTVGELMPNVINRIFGPKPKQVIGLPGKLSKFYNPQPGLLSIVTGMPGAGKSTFLDNLMLGIIDSCKWPFAVYSPENSPPDRHLSLLLEKMSCRKSHDMTESDVFKYAEKIKDYYFPICLDYKQLSLDEILDLTRASIFRHGVRGLIIDPWNLINHRSGGEGTSADIVCSAMAKLRGFAAKYQVHIWLVAHPRIQHRNADGYYSPPTMYSISGGASFFNAADFGLCLYQKYTNEPTNITSCFIQKVRFADYGRKGEVKFTVSSVGVFKDAEED